MDIMLPFKVGDLVESRSFFLGFRGAWFRSKICVMCVRQGHMECLLEYVDFPEEKKTWSRLYQIRPGRRKKNSSATRMIMLRPTFPPWYWENKKPDQLPNTDFVAIVSNPWKVGDLIEWWYDDCYWTGKIIEFFGDGKVKIALREEPIGEGGYYDAECKDLRPALDWSLEKGWSVPLSQENGECWYTAQLITQSKDTGSSSSDEDIEPSCGGEEELQKCLNGPSNIPLEVMDSDPKLSANINTTKIFTYNQGAGKKEPPNYLNGTSYMPQEVINSKVEIPSNQNNKCCMKSEIDSLRASEYPEALSDGQSSPISLKRQKISSEHASVQAPPDTVGDAVLELEKIANRIRRLENLLLSVGSAPSNEVKPSWKFLEKDASARH